MAFIEPMHRNKTNITYQSGTKPNLVAKILATTLVSFL